jgi:pyruvate/2-oxoglutarate dehydrogenase complex dihydrolipoamide dehydrogenase (E3) component
MMEIFDAIVIGAGEAGALIAGRAVEEGKKTALIYRPPYGSTCLNTGCVPSKFMIHRAKVAHLARVASLFHISAGVPQVDLPASSRKKTK